MASGSTDTKLWMKLLLNTKAQRVLYAEASKNVVDFLFSLLTLPVSTVVKLLTTDSMVGSVGNLYGSVEKLDDTYICSDGGKDALLGPANVSESAKLLQLHEAVVPESSNFFRCSSYRNSACYNNVTKGIVTYTVMDDLTVSPMSNISGITLLNTFGVTDIGSLKEKTVQLGYAEILKASLQSKTVLTDVFLAKNGSD